MVPYGLRSILGFFFPQLHWVCMIRHAMDSMAAKPFGVGMLKTLMQPGSATCKINKHVPVHLGAFLEDSDYAFRATFKMFLLRI